jgi:hypothetical protein
MPQRDSANAQSDLGAVYFIQMSHLAADNFYVDSASRALE